MSNTKYNSKASHRLDYETRAPREMSLWSPRFSEKVDPRASVI